MPTRVHKLKCPACDRRLKIGHGSISKSIVCPKCNTKFKIEGQSNTVVIDGQNEWFGPPVSDEFSNDTSFRSPANPFDNIDDLIDGANAQTDQQENDVKTKLNAVDKTQNSLSPRDNETIEKWEKEKRTCSRLEESLQRNGIGLLILATGLSLIPFFAASVNGLQPILPYVPIFGATLAFVGSFMIAYSLRRGNLAAVLVSGLPFILIGLISIGSYLYGSTFSRTNDAANNLFSNQTAERPGLARGDDRFGVDRESVTNNAASNFVAPKHDSQGLSDGRKPAAPADVVPSSGSGAAGSQIAESELRPSEIIKPNRKPDSGGNGEFFEQELRMASKISANADKLPSLQQRICNDLTKGLVSRSQVKHPGDLKNNFILSSVAGEETVYGVAYFSHQPVSGFDVAHNENSIDDFFDMIVPIIDEGEFAESITGPENSRFTGMNISSTEQGIMGVQGIFLQEFDDDSKIVMSPWVGRAPVGDSTATVKSSNRPVFGFVVYKDGLRAVGIQLIEGDASR